MQSTIRQVIAGSRFARGHMRRRRWPAVMVLVVTIVLGSFLVYTEHLVREIEAEAALHSRMYALVQTGLLSLEDGGELRALLALQQTLIGLGVPMVAVDGDGVPFAAVNLPFQADLADPTDRERVLQFARQLDAQNDPIEEPGAGTVYFGAPPVLDWLRWIPWLQVSVALSLLFVAFGLIRADMRAERERLWASMARELAHQMGTPLSALAGWIEMLKLSPGERNELADNDQIATELARDLERLERVSHRFELIGQSARMTATAPEDVVADVQEYLAPRIPRLGSGVTLRTRVAPDLPPVLANRVLLVWALENVMKNALDALAGSGGRIRLLATRAGSRNVSIFVVDSGPGVPPALRAHIFDAGGSTKPDGWGIGLSLARRIVEDVHHGRIALRTRRAGRTTFEISLPIAVQPDPRPKTRFARWWRERRGIHRHKAVPRAG